MLQQKAGNSCAWICPNLPSVTAAAAQEASPSPAAKPAQEGSERDVQQGGEHPEEAGKRPAEEQVMPRKCLAYTPLVGQSQGGLSKTFLFGGTSWTGHLHPLQSQHLRCSVDVSLN